MMTRWETIRYWFAELLFTKELDEDYAMGCREGERVARLVMAEHLRRIQNGASKSTQAGLALAIEEIKGRDV
jgi:hypothetical protein